MPILAANINTPPEVDYEYRRDNGYGAGIASAGLPDIYAQVLIVMAYTGQLFVWLAWDIR